MSRGASVKPPGYRTLAVDTCALDEASSTPTVVLTLDGDTLPCDCYAKLVGVSDLGLDYGNVVGYDLGEPGPFAVGTGGPSFHQDGGSGVWLELRNQTNNELVYRSDVFPNPG